MFDPQSMAQPYRHSHGMVKVGIQLVVMRQQCASTVFWRYRKIAAYCGRVRVSSFALTFDCLESPPHDAHMRLAKWDGGADGTETLRRDWRSWETALEKTICIRRRQKGNPALNSYFCHTAMLSMLHSQVLAVASYFVPTSLPYATVNSCLSSWLFNLIGGSADVLPD